MDALEVFGRNVRRLRTEQGLTQEQLAELAGLNLTDVGRIERARRDPGVRVVMKLADGLGVPVAKLFDGVGD
jgi:transcriptional regulator with XRE-family HTH domain